GSIMFVAGYSDRQGIILNGSVSQNNIFGTGNFFSLDVNTGAINKTYAASFTNPYFTVNGVSLGVDVFKRDINTRALSRVGAFKSETEGASVRMGIPIAENDIVSLSVGVEQQRIGLFHDSPSRYVNFINNDMRGDNQFINFPVILSWARDRRDSAIWTTSGTTHRVFAEASVPGADLNYYKVSYHQKWFYPISDTFTLMLNGEFGYADGYANNTLPFFKNFFAGGNNSVRGYDLNTLGPRDERRLSLGASKRVVGNIELLFPIPFMREDRSIRLSTFLDGGTVFDTFHGTTTLPNGTVVNNSLANNMRYSAGIAVTWVSPMGPLKVSLAEGLNEKPSDNMQMFQFMFGQQF
ncbi:MAG: outer membrane protein assembly factor BamA, partial [Pseudomonadota bacterium]